MARNASRLAAGATPLPPTWAVRPGRSLTGVREVTVQSWVARFSLLAVIASGLWLAGASAADDYIVDTGSAAEPRWVAGPLHGVLPALSDTTFSLLMIGAVIAYVALVISAPALPSRWLIVGVCIPIVAFTIAPPLLSSDVFGYIAYARLGVTHGLNPYMHGPIAAPHDAVLPFVYWQHPSTPYGPVFTLGSYAIGSASLPVALWTMKALEGVAALASVGLVWRAAQRFGRIPQRAVALVAANPLLLLFAVGGAHNDVVVMAVVLLSLLLLAGARQAGAGVALATAAAVKLTGGLLLPFALLGARGRSRVLAGIAIAGAVVVAVTLAAFGTHVFDTIAAIGTGQQFDAEYSGPDLLGRLLGTGITTTVRVVTLVGGGLVLAACLRATWRGADWVAAAGWTALAAILVVPSFVPWYVAWLLPFSALSRSRALIAATLVLTAGIAVTHLPLLGFPTFI